MRPNKLAEMGVPRECIPEALALVQAVSKYNRSVDKEQRLDIKESIKSAVVGDVKKDADQPYEIAWNELSEAVAEEQAFVRPAPIAYKTWGEEGIDEGSHAQMKQACSMPNAAGAALMPDAHLGYGLPIGGVLALDNAVCPFAVGVDIACRIKVSILDMPVWTIKDKANLYQESLKKGTVFGMGIAHAKPQDHAVMDDPEWYNYKVTREKKDKAKEQLGTSGSGNHFVEFGIVSLPLDEFGLERGEYVALMSHSGSRNVGHSVCSYYSTIASQRLPKKYEDLGRLAWLDLDTEAGQEYFNTMNLMGKYAAANHDVIHRLVTKHLGAKIIGGVENHHNFAWEEIHNGKKVIVHRKGATPAGVGVLGVIPGSMEHPAYLVRGKGNPDSLNSASHGAGRAMSRTKAKEKFSRNAVMKNLLKKGITVLGMGADESPGCYKNIDDVMKQQQDLIEVIGKFQPKIVMMDDSGSKAED